MVLTSRKNAAGPKGQVFQASHEEAQVSNGTQKAGWMRDSVFITLCWCVSVSWLCVVLWEALEMGPGEQKRASESIIYTLFVTKYGWVRSMLTIFLSPCPLRPSTSTVDRFFLVWGHIDGRYRPIFFCMNPHRRSISTDLLLKSTVDAISTVFSSRWIGIDRRYRPYSQVGDSLSTVDIDQVFKWVNPYRPSISTVTDRPVDEKLIDRSTTPVKNWNFPDQYPAGLRKANAER